MPPQRVDVKPVTYYRQHTDNILTFGILLQQLRRRAGMTQSELAVAVGFSMSHISNLEKNQRLPAPTVVFEKFIPALGLEDEPQTAQRLVELAAESRGERLPAHLYPQVILPAVTDPPPPNDDNTLPFPLMPILGREREVTTISNRLLGQQGRLFTLVGPPGIGKTTPGLAVASHVQASFEEGAYFIPLAAVTDSTQVGPALMNGLGLTESSTRSPQARLAEYLRQKRMLIVLDNFEQLLDATPLLLHLLQRCLGLHFLITSRIALRVPAEQRIKVAALAPEVAVQLFTQRAQAVKQDFMLTEETILVVKKICQQLDYLPLAIELFAPQLNLFIPKDALTYLQTHRLDLLDNDAPGLEARHQTLRRAIQSSYALLSMDEQAFFCQLGVFAGSFDLSASEALWANTQTVGVSAAKLLSALVNKSLVQVETQPQQQRFKLLETLREFAMEQLQAKGELDNARRQHAVYFCQVAEIANPLLRGPDEIFWLERLEANHDNLRAAIAWSLESLPDLENGLRLVGMLWWFWYVRSYLREGLGWLQKALAKDRGNTPALRAKLLQGASRFIWINNVPDCSRLSRALIEESVVLYRQLDDPWNLAKSLGYMAHGAETAAEFAPFAQEAKAIFRRTNDLWGLAWVPVMEFHLTAPELQHLPFEEGVAFMRAIEAKTGLALLLLAAGQKTRFQGHYEQARLYIEESIALYRQIGEKWTLASGLFSLGEILIAQKQWEGLADIYTEGLLLAQQTGDSGLEAQLRQRQAWVLLQGIN